MSKKKRDFNLNVGISSILFIFVILSLVSFSVLSLASSMSDYNLSNKIANNTTVYYEACNKAEEMLRDTDVTLKALYDTGISRAGFYEEVGKKMSFAIPVTDIQTLSVEINILYPEGPNENFYEVTSWVVETTGSLIYDESLPVYK